jgi:hypothetical protein
VCEKSLNDLVAALEKNQRDSSFQCDSPSQLALPPEIRTEKMQDSVKSMEEAINAPGTSEDKKVCWSQKRLVVCGLTLCFLALRSR